MRNGLPRRRPTDHGASIRLALLGLSATALTFALAAKRVALSDTAFWIVIGAAALCAIPSIALVRVRRPHRRAVLAAAECRRAARILAAFVASFRGERRRVLRWLAPHASSSSPTDDEVVAEYDANYRAFAERVYEEARELGAASPASRVLVEGRSVAHIVLLPEVFETAAQRLEEQIRDLR